MQLSVLLSFGTHSSLFSHVEIYVVIISHLHLQEISLFNTREQRQ